MIPGTAFKKKLLSYLGPKTVLAKVVLGRTAEGTRICPQSRAGQHAGRRASAAADTSRKSKKKWGPSADDSRCALGEKKALYISQGARIKTIRATDSSSSKEGPCGGNTINWRRAHHDCFVLRGAKLSQQEMTVMETASVTRTIIMTQL